MVYSLSYFVRHRFGTMHRFKIDIFNYALKQDLSLPYDYNSELRIPHSELIFLIVRHLSCLFL